MMKNLFRGLFLAALTLSLAGCKPASASRQNSSGYFQTDFQDESQFIVETIVSDLAEQIYYAKFHQLPAKKDFYVTANETAASSFATPVYAVQVDLDNKYKGFKTTLNVNGPIWSPEVYDDLASQLSQLIGLPAGDSQPSTDSALLAKLTDSSAQTIEEQNQRISKALEDNFSDGSLHEEAAVLLGAFTLREHSGYFYEIRSPLCRITAHLAMARYLQNKNLSPVNGRMAVAILDTLMNNEAAALDTLSDVKTNNPALVSWVRALQAHITGDYRPLDKLDGLSQIECVNWYSALDRSANDDIAWGKLSDAQKRIPDFIRLANEGNYSVAVGHELVELSLPLEYKEIETIYPLSRQQPLDTNTFITALNQMPDRCFSPGPDGKFGVHVIGWGLWAGFFQRQLCFAMKSDFNFLQRKWGVPEDAKSYSEKCDQMFSGLRLYPFVRRFNCMDVASYHQSVDDGFKVTVATPQLVPAECWNYLCYQFSRTELYQPNPNPHVNEWHAHNPPPSTAYNPTPRLDHPSLVGRPDTAALLDKLHDLAPYDSEIAYCILRRAGGNSAPYALVSGLFQPVIAYANYAMLTEADTPEVRHNPEQYEKLLSAAANVDPADYFTLGGYFADNHLDDKAAAAYEQGNTLCPDTILASYHADWLIKYYLKKNETEKARQVADSASDTYSAVGLEAKAHFLEDTGDYTGAYEWYLKVEDRYNNSRPLVGFFLYYKDKTKETRFDAELQKRINTLFPRGIQKVKLEDFQSPPTEGVVFTGDSSLLRAAGLHPGDVMVAVYGVRIYDKYQYQYGRQIHSTPELDLIAWIQNDHAYREIKCSPPDHRFGAPVDTYHPQ